MQLSSTKEFYFSIFEKKKLFKFFPNLKNELLEQYNQILKNSNELKDIDIFQEYFQTISTGIKDDFYKVSWSISKIKKFISENNFSSKDFNLNEIFSDDNSLNETKSHSYKNTNEINFKPIFISYYQPIETYIVVDGNHRVNEIKRRGIQKISGFGLSPYCNEFVMNNFSFNLYKFHHNLVALHSLCKDPFLWKFKTNKSLMKNSFYGDNVEFNNLKFKKIIILFN